MKKYIPIALFILALTIPAFGEEAFVQGLGLDTTNEIERRLLLIEGTTITTVARGGTGSDHSGTVSGGIFYFSDTGVISVLAKGSDGEILFLESGIPAWASQDVKLLSVTSVSGAGDSGNITIEPNKYYYVVAEMTAPTGNTSLSMRFNSDSTSTGYAWESSQTLMHTTPTVTTTGDNSDGIIRLVTGVDATSGWIKANLFIDTYKIGTAVSAAVTAQATLLGSDNNFQSVEGYGVCKLNLTITDFEMLPGSGTADFDIRVYELIQS